MPAKRCAGANIRLRAFVEACIPEPGSEHLRRWGRQILIRADPDAAARMSESHDVPRIAPNLGAIRVPTLGHPRRAT